MPSSECITDHGEVGCDLSGLIERINLIPESGWVFRGDPESYETKVVRQGHEWFPAKEVGSVLKAVECFGAGYTNRVVLSCVPAGKWILPHTDDFGEEVRRASHHCHIPLITHPSVVMGFPEHKRTYHLQVGHIYSMDETLRHYVKNDSGVDRVHLLFAFFPHAGLK